MKNIKLKKINTDKLTKDFFNLLEKLNKNQWEIKINRNWTIKDCIAHLIGWEKEGIKVLRKCWDEEKNPWFMKNDKDYRKFNKKTVKKYHNFKPNELINEWKKWQKCFENEVEKIGTNKLRKNPEFDWVFDETSENHYLHHLKQIKKSLIKK